MQAGKSIFITGVGRGLGKELVKSLTKNHPQVNLHVTTRGQSPAFKEEWNKEFPNNKITHYKLDQKSEQLRKSLSEKIKTDGIKFDVMVFNSSVGFDQMQFSSKVAPTPQVAQDTFQTNIFSTIGLIKQLIPFLQNDGRIVIVSSVLAMFYFQPQDVKKLLDSPNIKESDIHKIAESYVECCKKKELGDFSGSSYCLSKALINAWARFILPTFLQKSQQTIAMHPGWCKTDMGGPQGQLSAEEGAENINKTIWLKEVDQGKFWNQKWVSYADCE